MSKNIKLFGILFTASLLIVLGCAKKKAEVVEEVVEEPVEEIIEVPEDTMPSLEEITAKLSTVHFDFDKYAIRPGDAEILREDAEVLRIYPDVMIVIEGHCDERGTNEYNMALGERRANSAKDFLVNLGIEEARFSTISYGEENPVALDHNESAWSQNRRAEFKVR